MGAAPAPASATISGSTDPEFLELNQRAAASLQDWILMIKKFKKVVELLGTQKDTHELRESLYVYNARSFAFVHSFSCLSLFVLCRAQVQQVTHHMMGETGHAMKVLFESRFAHSERARVDKLRASMKQTIDDYHALEREAATKQKQFVAIAQRQTASARAELAQDDAGERQRAEERQALLSQERQRQAVLEDEIQFNDIIIQVWRRGWALVGLFILTSWRNKERIESIREIESSILDINALYRDLGMQVELQGQMIGALTRQNELCCVT
jgi:hypothetical protein